MKADEYMVLQMAIDDGVAAGFYKIFPDESSLPTHMYESQLQQALAEAVMEAILTWFHIERPWVRESDV